MSFVKWIYLLIATFTCTIGVFGQDAPIGSWESHLPYNTALGVATDGSTIYTICNQAFFSYNPNNNTDPETFSKVEGMSDVGMQCVGYDSKTGVLVLVYSDGNIDLFKNNTFYNIPDLKDKVVPQIKQVYQVYTDNGFAYLSTTLGLLVLDLENHDIYKSYQFYNFYPANLVPVTSFIVAGNYYYMATGYGLYTINKDAPNLQDFGNWQKIKSTDTILSVTSVNGTLFFSSKKKISTLVNDSLVQVYKSPETINHVNAGNANLLIGVTAGHNGDGAIKIMNLNYVIIDSFDCGRLTAQAVQLPDNSLWVAAPTGGLMKRTDLNQTQFIVPDGPTAPGSFDIYAYNRDVWVAHGGYNTILFAAGTTYGLSNFHDNKWTLYKDGLYPAVNGVRDIVSVIKDELTGTVYAGSYLDGLVILHDNGNESRVEYSSVLEPSYAYGDGTRQVLYLALDKDDNLWMTQMYTPDKLYVKTKDSAWYKFTVPAVSSGGPMAIDDNSQIWFGSLYGGGMAVYNTGNSISDPSDDKSYYFYTGVGHGNLPGSNVLCIAKDNNNQIWVGTDNGIGVISNCNAPFSATACDAVWPLVKNGLNQTYLFGGDNVNTIAVDVANRKWIGTQNGVTLLSADGLQVLQKFTQANSPLPSDDVQKITIDKATGDIYIGTQQGLVCYRSSGTEGENINKNVLVFPNPVPTGYAGTIAITGLVANADVRITDIDGQLVYRTKALGGQATWNGYDYSGHRPQSGVYLIFATDGKQTYTGKIVFMQ